MGGSWSRFTYDFEEMAAYLAHLAQITDQTQVSRLLGISWQTVGAIIERVVADRLESDRFVGLRCIGVDEFSYHKHHRYLTLVVDTIDDGSCGRPRVVARRP